ALSVYFFYASGALLDLHSFPTRRSSDLCAEAARGVDGPVGDRTRIPRARAQSLANGRTLTASTARGHARDQRERIVTMPSRFSRSEEHTSELQSRGHLVCRLLLEKKK